MDKDSVMTWEDFKAAVERFHSTPYMMFYRRYKLRTMRQKKGESLCQYTTKFQQYVSKAGIPNNEELVFNYLCSLNGRYCRKS